MEETKETLVLFRHSIRHNRRLPRFDRAGHGIPNREGQEEWFRRQRRRHEFDPTCLRDVKEQGVTGMRASHKFIVIPPGESKKKALPPATLLHYMRKSAYQQGSNLTCLLDSLSSAMAEFGCIQQVELLRNHVDCKKLSQSNVNLMAEFGNQVNRQFKGIGLQMFRQKTKRLLKIY